MYGTFDLFTTWKWDSILESLQLIFADGVIICRWKQH